MADTLNADFARRVVMDTAAMAWQASPSFPEHDHPEGEEILVLQGSLSDEHGDYPAGTYLLNPPGFRHAPFSNRGCIIFVKLRQYGGERREHVVVDTKSANWTPGPVPGVDLLPLYHNARHPETMELLHFSGGAALPHHDCPGGTELRAGRGPRGRRRKPCRGQLVAAARRRREHVAQQRGLHALYQARAPGCAGLAGRSPFGTS